MGKQKLGYDVDVELKSAFADWTDSKGLTETAAAEAALVIVQFCPSDLRDLAIARDSKSVKAWFDKAMELVMQDRLVQARRSARHAARRRKGGESAG